MNKGNEAEDVKMDDWVDTLTKQWVELLWIERYSKFCL